MLGPKTEFYRALAHEMWGPILRRGEVRHAMFWASGGVFLMTAGVVGVALTGEALLAIVIGLLSFAAAWSTWKSHRHLYRAWRQIGSVNLLGPPLEHTPDTVSVVTLQIEPRSDGQLQEASLTFDWRDSRSGPAGTAWAVDVPLSDPTLRAGAHYTLTADVCLPPGVPPSHFDTGWTRQWNCTARVQLTDGREWWREYPVIVLPTP